MALAGLALPIYPPAPRGSDEPHITHLPPLSSLSSPRERPCSHLTERITHPGLHKEGRHTRQAPTFGQTCCRTFELELSGHHFLVRERTPTNPTRGDRRILVCMNVNDLFLLLRWRPPAGRPALLYPFTPRRRGRPPALALPIYPWALPPIAFT